MSLRDSSMVYTLSLPLSPGVKQEWKRVRRFILRIPTFQDKSRLRSTGDIDDFGKDFLREMDRQDSLADTQAERDALMAQAPTPIATKKAVRTVGYFPLDGANISQLSPPKCLPVDVVTSSVTFIRNRAGANVNLCLWCIARDKIHQWACDRKSLHFGTARHTKLVPQPARSDNIASTS